VVTGLPDGVPFKSIKSYGIADLRAISECKLAVQPRSGSDGILSPYDVLIIGAVTTVYGALEKAVATFSRSMRLLAGEHAIDPLDVDAFMARVQAHIRTLEPQ
jgi:hypothetical protein